MRHVSSKWTTHLLLDKMDIVNTGTTNGAGVDLGIQGERIWTRNVRFGLQRGAVERV